MNQIRTKIKGVEQIYNSQGGGKKMYKEKEKSKTSDKQTNKLVILKEFEPLLKDSVIKLFSDINNYTNTLECQICHKEIQDTMEMNYFHLHTEDNKNFITFHFLCALRPNSILKFQDIMDKFDYTSRIDNSKVY